MSPPAVAPVTDSSPSGALLCQADAPPAALLAGAVRREETGIVRQVLARPLHHIDQALPVPAHCCLCGRVGTVLKACGRQILGQEVDGRLKRRQYGVGEKGYVHRAHAFGHVYQQRGLLPVQIEIRLNLKFFPLAIGVRQPPQPLGQVAHQACCRACLLLDVAMLHAVHRCQQVRFEHGRRRQRVYCSTQGAQRGSQGRQG